MRRPARPAPRRAFRDAWFIGYTAHLTTGVWAGNDDGRAMNRVVGGSLPAEIWREIMIARACRQGAAAAAGRRAGGGRRAAEPVYPQERIADDFIARALGGEAQTVGRRAHAGVRSESCRWTIGGE